MTHDKLLEAIDFLPLDGLHAWMQPALRAVVELHKPKPAMFERYCLQCMENRGDGEIVNVAYPCRTIQAIERELE